jgi:hypothetical protein
MRRSGNHYSYISQHPALTSLIRHQPTIPTIVRSIVPPSSPPGSPNLPRAACATLSHRPTCRVLSPNSSGACLCPCITRHTTASPQTVTRAQDMHAALCRVRGARAHCFAESSPGLARLEWWGHRELSNASEQAWRGS